MTDQLNADQWLISTFNALIDYMKQEIDNFVLNAANAPAGLQAYDVVVSYPDSDDLPKAAEFDKTIIHLEIDDIDNRNLGFGPGIVNSTFVDAIPAVEPSPPGAPGVAGTITEEEGRVHEINFDVGVWASDKSGGVSSRLVAYQMLDSIFGGEMARQKCRTVTGGVEIRRFQNGRFVIERPNDVRLFRIVGAELVVRVYSRKVAGESFVYPDRELIYTPDVEIGSVPVIDD